MIPGVAIRVVVTDEVGVHFDVDGLAVTIQENDARVGPR